MKHFILIVFITLSNFTIAQNKWFSQYNDSIALVTDGKNVTEKFIKQVRSINPNINFEVSTVLHTTPYLIYFDGIKKTANLPLWSQVIPEQQQFFYEVAGSEIEGKKAFGYFFNGFYLPHELGHALQELKEGNLNGSYENEYFANTVALLWWKKNSKEKELKLCYESAKKMWAKLPNPVPEGMTTEDYFSKNYEKASENPYVYGYMQFKQFIQLYEDKNLPNFDKFIESYLAKK